MGRLYDFLKEEMNLYQAIEKIELKVKEIMQTNRESYLENHGFSHIERVIKYVEEAYDCYFQKDMPLNSYECFVLLAAIYIHDIGFFLHDEKTIEAFCKHKKIRFCKEHEEDRLMRRIMQLEKIRPLPVISLQILIQQILDQIQKSENKM